MGALCCGRSKQDEVSTAHKPDDTHSSHGKNRAAAYGGSLRHGAVPFDVVVPSSPRGGQDMSMTLNAFDQTMYTVRDDDTVDPRQIDLSSCNNTYHNLDANMSFTNSFNHVNTNAVKRFMDNIAQIASSGGGAGGVSMIEEMSSRGRSAPGDSISSRSPITVGMTPEDEEYIHDGESFHEKCSRLFEVEEVLRQQISGAWNMNTTLLGLAVARVVPTIRQRRDAWNKQREGADGAAEDTPSKKPKKSQKKEPPRKPVLVIHAAGIDLESSGNVGPPRSPEAAMFSPAEGPDNSAPSTPTHLNRSMSSRARLESGSHRIEHYEVLALNCRDVTPGSKVKSKVETDTWDFLSKDTLTSSLNSGECVFRFMCGPVHQMDTETLDQMNLFINVSSFADEEKENNAPIINVRDSNEMSKYIGIVVKAMYMLPGARLSDITVDTVSSRDYQKACQPSANKLEECHDKHTIRLTLNIVRFIFSLTVQFKISEITDPAKLAAFKSADGIVPAKIIMLERTKRNIGKVDATAKVKSALVYYPVNGGVLVNSQTFVLNTSLPNVVAKLVNTFGSQGAAQSAETAELTRKHLLGRYGDCRKE